MESKQQYILTIDVGSGSGRCLLFDLEGNQVSSAQREWLPKANPKYPGSLDFDTEEAWRLIVETIHEAMGKVQIPPSAIAAVMSTSMREGMVLYNREKRVIWACPNVDARATAEVVEMVQQDLGRPIYKIGGDWLSIISPPRLWWIRKHQPEIYEQIAHMNMLSDWVLFQLSGNLVTDPSIGSSSGIFDLQKRDWSDEIVRLADLPRGIYADVHEAGSVIGAVTKKTADETGLKAGTPVITSGGDTQLALVGVGAVEAGKYTLCGGTFWQATLVSDRHLYDPEYRLRLGCHSVPGKWMTEGIGFYLGFTMRWFRDGFCQEEKRIAQEQGIDAYTVMEKLASEIPAGSNGVQAIFSYVMDVKRWRHATPSFVGFDIVSPERTGKSACIRAIEENAAYVSRSHFETLAALSGNAPDEIVFAGGSSKGFLWPQIIADVMGVPIRIPLVKEATSLGSAICVLMGIGECKTWDEAAARVIRWDRTFEPDPDNHAIYDETYNKWFEVYRYMLPLADDRVLPSLWARTRGLTNIERKDGNMLEKLRQDVLECNLELPKYGLVVMTSGNVSGRDPETNLIVIKPSGVRYDRMRAQDLVILDLDNNIIEGDLKPSVDTESHLYIYRNRPDIFGVCHTHSTFASVFAALGRPIPPCLTATAMLGGEIPVGDFIPLSEAAIGEEIIRKIGDKQAVLMQNHGVFTIGKDAFYATKMAIEVENIAKITYFALLLDSPILLNDEQVNAFAHIYHNVYGQHS